MKGLSSLFLRILISLLITLALGILFLSIEEPYTLELREKRPWEPEKNTSYSDLDSDGKTERILLSNSASGQLGLVVYNHADQIINQYNILGKYVKRSQVYSGDYNNDRLSELYVFTYIADSLFLNIIDIYDKVNPYLRRTYIPGCTSLHGEAQYIITAPVFEDANNDGKLEFYFAISAGFSLQPRSLYYYDIVNNSIERSAEAGVAPRYTLDSYDLDGDGKLEIWGRSNAVGNYSSFIPYSDSSAWLMIYDYKLDYLFEPFEFRGFTSVLFTRVLDDDKELSLLTLRTQDSSVDSIENEVAIFSVTGDLLARESLHNYNLGRDIFCYPDNKQIYLLDSEGRVLILNRELEPQKTFQREALHGSKYGLLELPGSGLKIFICQNLEGDITIFSSELKKMASIALNDNSVRNDFRPVFVSRGEIDTGFHLRTYKSDYVFSLERNISRNYIFIYALTLFVAFYLIIYFIQLQQRRQEEKKRETESKMRALQVQAAKSQMSPHFIFNALNSISAMYIKGDTARADAFLSSFSKMIREVVNSSDRLVVNIREELEFVKNYLELEKVRHEDKLSYSITIPDECIEHELPSMCIHTFVENSIKHGFVGGEKMDISVDVSCGKNYIIIRIRDNGTGYRKHLPGKDKTGKGLKIVGDIFESYRLIKGRKIDYSISDLSESAYKERKGTLVTIKVQL